MHRGGGMLGAQEEGVGAEERRVFTLNTLPIHIPELRIRGGMHRNILSFVSAKLSIKYNSH